MSLAEHEQKQISGLISWQLELQNTVHFLTLIMFVDSCPADIIRIANPVASLLDPGPAWLVQFFQEESSIESILQYLQ